MASFAGTKIKDTYGNVLQVANSNDGVDGTLRTVDDGKGDASALKISTGAIQVDNIKVDGNTISSTDTNGNISLTPNGSGSVAVPNLELGHATDTTITRASSGDLAIEGNAIYRAGGTDVPVADGGTGASTLSSGQVLLGNGTSAIQSRAIGIANDNIVEIDHASVADDDYAKFTGNGLEGRSYSEVLSDIGAQASLTFGIANTNAVKIDHASVADDDYAKFTANGVEGRSYAEVKTDLSLNNVENTAISTFAGTSNIATTGALDSGSISSGFGNIDVGSSNLTATGTISLGATSFNDNSISNVNDIALVTISSDAGTSIGVTLGTDAGDDFNVGSGKLVVEGDTSQTGINTATPTEKLEVNGGIIASNSANRSSGEGIVMDYVTGSDLGRIAVGDWGTAYEELQIDAEKYTLDVGASGNILAHHVNNVGDSLFMTSTGVGRIGANTISVADDTTVSIAGAGEGAMSHVYIYERSNGSGAIFTVNYHTGAIKVTEDNVGGYTSSRNFFNSSTEDGICLYKNSQNHTVTFENKTGDTRAFKIMIVGAGQAPVI